jgi:predicted porin
MKGLGTAAASAAVLLLSGAGGAYAADLALKAPAAAPADAMCSSLMDFFVSACQVSAYGVRFYGTIDVGASYENHGVPTNKYLGNNNFLGKMNNGAQFLANPNGLSASNIGFQIKEPLGNGWSFVGQVEAGFSPVSMHLLNGVHSVFDAIGTPLANQTAFGDSNSQGAFYNDLGFTGFSHDTWGTITFFRQNDLMQDGVLSYDPMGVSGTFSPLGFFGSFAGGGDTQNRRDTTAIKYRVNIANWHFGAYGQLGGYDEGNGARGGAQGDVGADFHLGPGLLSMDGIVAWKKDGVSLGNGLAGQTDPFGNPININVGGTLFGGTQINALSSVISNNTTVMALAKYQVDRWKLYAGYERIEFANPSDPGITSLTDIAGDFLCAGCQGFNGTNITTNFYNVHKIDQLAWVGAKYAITDSLDVTAAYYHEWQNDFSGGASNNVVGQVLNSNGTFTAQKAVACSVASTASSKCAGTKDTVSAVLDWRFAPKWDTYIGGNYNANTGGDANGFLNRSEWSSTAGVRFRW